MKRLLLFLILAGLLLEGCASTLTPDVKSTVQAALAATLAAQPTKTPIPTPTEIPTRTPTREPTRTPTREPTPTLPPPPAKAPVPFALTLETYQGQGFSFQYPANAQLENVPPNRMAWQVISPATTELHVIGPDVWIKPGNADWSFRGTAYHLTIRTYENSEELDAEMWARNYVLRSWREAREQNRPWGSLPVSEEGKIDEDKVGSSIISGQPVFWINYFSFDSYNYAYYVVNHHKVIELSFYIYPVENQPLAMVQRDIYALILGTLHLEEK